MSHTFARFLPVAAAVCLVAGCEWSSSSSGDSWSDAYNDMNFAGTYRSASVQTSTDGTTTTTRTVSNERVGTVSTGNSASFNLGNSPVVAGSVVITVGGDITFQDNGSGTLTCTSSHAGASGTISYDSGAGTVFFDGDPYVGQPIVASYSFTATSTGGSNSSSARSITSVTVSQSGQHLTLHCNNGYVLSGRFNHVNTLSQETTTSSGRYNAQFEVSNDAGVKMVGTLQHVNSYRQLDGTLTDSTGTYDITGTASGTGSSDSN